MDTYETLTLPSFRFRYLTELFCIGKNVLHIYICRLYLQDTPFLENCSGIFHISSFCTNLITFHAYRSVTQFPKFVSTKCFVSNNPV